MFCSLFILLLRVFKGVNSRKTNSSILSPFVFLKCIIYKYNIIIFTYLSLMFKINKLMKLMSKVLFFFCIDSEFCFIKNSYLYVYINFFIKVTLVIVEYILVHNMVCRGFVYERFLVNRTEDFSN